MAAPVIVACTKEAWTKVATATQSGLIHLKTGVDQVWLQTYVLTGASAPSDDSTAVIFGKDSISGETEEIGASAPSDVYVYPTKKDGSVRVEL